jgi:hypothetical protein
MRLGAGLPFSIPAGTAVAAGAAWKIAATAPKLNGITSAKKTMKPDYCGNDVYPK